MAQLRFTTEKVFEGHMKVNACGHQWLGDRDYNTLRENGRRDFSIHYVLQGKAAYTLGGKTYPVPEGCLLLHFPGVRQHYSCKKEDDTQMLWTHFSGSACSVLDCFTADTPVVLKVYDRKQFEFVFEKMIDAHNNRLMAGDLLCDSYMPVLLALITQPVASTQRGHRDEQMDQVLSRMHLDFNKPIDIAAYAAMCHVSEDRFIRSFKAYTGLPPYRYQLKLRIQRAVEMLENTAASVAQCGESVGFHDNAYFCRVFKKFTGHPPSFYRRK